MRNFPLGDRFKISRAIDDVNKVNPVFSVCCKGYKSSGGCIIILILHPYFIYSIRSYVVRIDFERGSLKIKVAERLGGLF